jgi:transcriptional regulator with XRE-family HTH domain
LDENITIGLKIWQIAESQGYKKQDFARKMNISRTTLDSWIEGNSEPRYSDVMNMSKILGHDFNPETALREAEKNIPFYDVIATAGSSIMINDQEATYANSAELINPGSWFKSATGALRVYGHSMFPKYPAGCIVAFKEADKDVIIWGEDYIIELEDRRVVKRIEKGENGFVKAVSYNKSEEYVYASIDIPINKIKRLYMVLGKVELETSI